MKKIDISPTTDLLHSLKRTGHHWSTALMDIIDNSVDTLREKYDKTGFAEGMIRVIPITCKSDSAGTKVKKIIISDNGMGIPKAQLENILRFGESGKRGAPALGTFGMGLKTAAMAIGDKISVVSTARGIENLHYVTWDVEECLAKGTYDANFGKASEDLQRAFLEYVGFDSGTMVIVGKLDDGFPTRPAMVQTLSTKCARVYRHLLNEDSVLGQGFPFQIICGKTLNSKPVDSSEEPMYIGAKKTSILIGEQDGKFKEMTYGDYIYNIRMVLFEGSPKDSQAARASGLGRGIHGTHKQGVYWIRGGREISCGSFWKVKPQFSNVYAEISFEDTGIFNESKPIRMDFGKKNVELDDDFKQHLLKNVFGPYLEKIMKEQKEKAKSAKKSDRTSIMKSISRVKLPTDKFGRAKAPPKTRKEKAALSLFSPGNKNNTKKRSNSKYRGTDVNLGDNETEIDFEECCWKGSDLPFCIDYSVGDPVLKVQLNVEDPWIEKNIYLCNKAEQVARNLQLVAAAAVSMMHEKSEDRIETYRKMGALLNLFDEDFGRVKNEIEKDFDPILACPPNTKEIEELVE
jgi:hypothetical protein